MESPKNKNRVRAKSISPALDRLDLDQLWEMWNQADRTGYAKGFTQGQIHEAIESKGGFEMGGDKGEYPSDDVDTSDLKSVLKVGFQRFNPSNLNLKPNRLAV